MSGENNFTHCRTSVDSMSAANLIESKSDFFESKVDETFDSLPATSPLGMETEGEEALVHKLRAIASQEGFEVDRMLGRGGMGAVVSATDRELGRKVALKFLARSSNDRSLEDKLKREAERASKLDHENIVRIYSWHSVGGLTFFSMEYVEGETFQEYIESRDKPKVSEILRIIGEAAGGVAAAHDLGLLHRDIKPQNLLISKSGRVKVTDFGLASNVKEKLSSGGKQIISGTVGFMAPEQARGEKQSFENDVFSLTATLYYGLTRQMPFGKSRDFKLLLKANQKGKIVPLFTVRDDLPQAVYPLIAKGLSREKARRFRDAEDFKRAVHDVLLHLDVSDSAVLRKQARQRRWAKLAFPVGIALGFALGFAICYWMFAI